MNHITKSQRILALLLTAVLCFSLLPAGLLAQAAEVTAQDCWSVTTKLTVNEEEKTGSGSIEIPADAKVSVDLNFSLDETLAAQNEIKNANTRKDVTFTITIPAAIMDLLTATGGSIKWSDTSTSGGTVPTFVDENGNTTPVPVHDTNAGNYIYTIKFNPALDADGTAVYPHAKMTFAFETSAKFNMVVKTEDGSTTIEYGTSTPTVDPAPSLAKSDAYIVRKGADDKYTYFYGTSSGETKVLQVGDYVVYRVTLNQNNDQYGSFSFPTGTVEDYFPTNAYTFVDTATSYEIAKEIVDETSANEIKTNPIWTPHSSCEKGSTYTCYTNSAPIDIVTPKKEVVLFMWLQYKGLDTSNMNQNNWNSASSNHVAYGQVHASDYPGIVRSYFDAALTILPTTVHREATLADGVFTSAYDNYTGGTNAYFGHYHQLDGHMDVRKGDYVTYYVNANSQAERTGSDKIYVYLPYGLEMVTEDISSIKYYAEYGDKPVVLDNGISTDKNVYKTYGDATSEVLTRTPAPHLTSGVRKDTVYPKDTAENGQTLGYNYSFGDDQFIDSLFGLGYTIYEFDLSGYKGTTEEAVAGKTGVVGSEKFFFTVKVTAAADELLAAIGRPMTEMTGKETATAMAALDRYGLLVLAEIGHNYNAVKDDSNYGVAVVDNDSVADMNPFNDWFKVNEDRTYSNESKNPNLYLGTGHQVGEKENLVGDLVLDSGKIYGSGHAGRDEDDFDMALLNFEFFQQNENISKTVLNANSAIAKSRYEKIVQHCETTGKTYTNGKTLLAGTTITSVDTVIPYQLRINEYGAENMKEVVITDTLPAGLSFLCDENGVPFVFITELTQPDDKRVSGYNNAGEPVMILSPKNSMTRIDVKAMNSNAYTGNVAAALPPHPPSLFTVNEGSVSGEWVASVDPSGRTLTMELGDIDFCSYEITYYVVVDAYSPSYTNKAVINSKDRDPESAQVVAKNSDATAQSLGYSKQVVENDLLNHEITYEIFLGFNVSGAAYQSRFLLMEDAIDDLLGGFSPENVSLVKQENNENFYITRSSDGTSYAKDTSGDLLVESSVTGGVNRITFTNDEDIDSTALFKVRFTLKYEEIPYGEVFVNRFGSSEAEATTPFRLELTKVNEAGDTRLNQAVFALFYADGTTAVTDKEGTAITLTTAGEGENAGIASAIFELDDGKAVSETWTLVLKETAAPSGYQALTEDITLTVTRSGDEYTYSANTSENHALTVASDGAMKLTVKNTEDPTQQPDPDPATVSVGVLKTLKDGLDTAITPLPDEIFSFEMTCTSGEADNITVGGNPFGAKQTATNDTTGAVTFPAMTISAPGTYVFEVTEAAAPSGYTKDTSTVTVTVVVSEGESSLTAVTTYSKGDVDGEKTFVNTLSSVSANFEASKTLLDAEGEDMELTDGQFSFTATLTSENAAYVDGLGQGGTLTAENDEDGDVSFDSLTFYRAGVYEFTISESTASKDDEISYDNTNYKAIVTVTAAGNGGLNTPVVTYRKGAGAIDVSGADFVNRVRPTDSFELTAEKLLDGEASKTIFSFTASIDEEDAEGLDFTGMTNVTVEDDVVILTATNNSNGEVSFGTIGVKSVSETYTFTIAETVLSSASDRYTYDDTIYTAEVAVVYDESGEEPFDIDITYNDEADIPVFENTTHPVITLTKKDEAGEGMKDITFTLTSADGETNYGDHVTDEDGNLRIVLDDIDEETSFLLTETTPEGYYDIDPIEIELEDGKYDYHYDVVNVTEKEISVIKVAASNPETTLAGAVFQMFLVENGEDGEQLVELYGEETLVTGADGVLALLLPADYAGKTFVLREISAPGGYTTSGLGDIRLTVNASGAITVLTHEGSSDYVALAEESQISIVVKNATRPSNPDPKPKPDPEPKPAEAVLTAKKVLDGKAPGSASFTFRLMTENGAVVEEQVCVSNGAVTFDTLYFEEEGTFAYTIREVVESGTGYTYDLSTYTATIVVTKDKDYKAKVTYEKNGDDYTGTPRFENVTIPVERRIDVSVAKVWDAPEGVEIPEEIVVQLYQNGVAYGDEVTLDEDMGWRYTWEKLDQDFSWTVDEVSGHEDYVKTITSEGTAFTITNTWDGELPEEPITPEEPVTPEVRPVSVALSARKTLDGNAPGSAPFRFILRDEAGNIQQTVNSTAAGEITFTTMEFHAAGTYVFTVEEAAGTTPVILYDDAVYTVQVVVTLSGDRYQAELVFPDSEGAPLFRNTSRPGAPDEEYIELDEDGVPRGRWVPDGDGWTFVELEDGDTPKGGFLPATGSAAVAALAMSGLLLAAAGTFLSRKKQDEE